MLRIPCPYCGVRDEPEFTFGGPSHVTRPAVTVTDAEWADYLFNRDNPKGIHYERWGHAYGCGRWFNMARHTVTHEILAVYPMGEEPPVLDAARSGRSQGLDRVQDADRPGERSTLAS
jgi:heterotetrameric sarcosine oxidase delta subunit